MGRPMAARLAAHGAKVCAHDARLEAAHGLEKLNITWGESIHCACDKADIVFTMLYSGEQVQKAMLQPDGILDTAPRDAIIVDMTTSDPAISQILKPKCEEKDIYLLDAPVSGGVEAAQSGSLTFMIGGEKEHIDRVQPLLKMMGKKFFHMGPLGSGYAMKLMNNFLSAVAIAATSEVVAIARKSGIPAERVLEVLKNSTGTNDAVARKFPQYILPDREIGFTIELMHKDIKTYLQFAERTAVPTFLSGMVFQIWNLQLAEDRGQMDAIHFVEPYERWCGLSIRGITSEKKE